MLCKLKGIARITDSTTDAIEKFFSKDEAKKLLLREREDKKASSLLVPPDEQLLGDSSDVEGDDLAERNTGLNNWLMESASEKSESDAQTEEDRRWIKTSLITASHNLDILVIAAVQKFVILQSSSINSGRFEPIAWVRLDLDESTAKLTYITAVYPLCIASTRSVDSSIVDWTCICVGLSDGTVNFYTERGICIFTEKCSNSPIKALRFGLSVYPGNQELIAFTNANKIIVFEGLSLFSVLKAARNQIAFGERSLQEISDTLQINCHCVELDHLKHTHDVINTGVTKPSSFDQYVSASCSFAGKDARVSRSSLPIYTNYMCSDRDKFTSFVWHHAEISGSELLTDAIYSFTSQITSSMPSLGIRSWLGIGTSRKDRPLKTRAIDARSFRAHERSALFDAERSAERCYLAPPGWRLVAVADSCARVLLIDITTRRVIRIWKGYRNARCAWVEAAGTSNFNEDFAIFHKSKARTLFLVIFAPKRGLLEVWSMQNGPRVSAFKVHEKGRLLTIDCGQNATLMGSSAATNFGAISNYTTAAFLSPDGTIFALDVPFHLSALDVSVSSIHDENFLKSFDIFNVTRASSHPGGETASKSSPSSGGLNLEKWTALCMNLKTLPAKRRFVDILVNSSADGDGDTDNGAARQTTIPLGDVHQAIEQLFELLTCGENNRKKSSEEPSNLSPFQHYVNNLNILLHIYSRIQSLSSCDTNSPPQLDYGELRTLLRLNANEFDALELPLLRNCVISSPQKSPYQSMSLRVFKEEFEMGSDTILNGSPTPTEIPLNSKVRLRPSAERNFAAVGSMIFGKFLSESSDLRTLFDEILPRIQTSPCTFVEIFVDFWLDSSWNVDPQAWTFRGVEILVGLISMCKLYHDYKEAVELIEKRIFHSASVHSALLLCLQLRVARIRRVESAEGSNVKRMKMAHPSSSSASGGDELCVKPSEINQAQGSGSKEWRKTSTSSSEEQFTLIEDDDVLCSWESAESAARADGPTEWFELLTKHLSVLALIQRLPPRKCDSSGGDEEERAEQMDDSSGGTPLKYQQVTVAKLAHKGYGFYREQIGVWCVSRSPNPYELACVLSGKEAEESERDAANCLSPLTTRILTALRNHLPETLRPELTLCDCCWECVSAWSHDESRRVTMLMLALKYLHQLESVPRLQHGLAATVWSTFLRDSFKNLFTLMNGQNETISKFSSLSSRDRVLKRDVLIVEADLPEYVECVRQTMRILANSVAAITGDFAHSPAIQHDYEPFVVRFFGHSNIVGRKTEKTTTLSEIAGKCKPVNYHLVLHHVHLATSITLITNTRQRVRPNTLFDSVGQMALFAPMDTHPLIPLANVDDRTRGRRQRFLEKVVETISTNGIGGCSSREDAKRLGDDHAATPTASGTPVGDGGGEVQRDPTDSSTSWRDEEYEFSWELIMGLAKDWQLDVNVLRAKEITMLYQFGFDNEAEKLMSKVDNKIALMQALLPLIAARIKHFTDEEPKLFNKMFGCSAGSDRTIEYVKKINDVFAPKFADVTVKGLHRLIRKANSLAKTRPKTLNLDDAQSSTTTNIQFNLHTQMIKEFGDISNVIERYYGKMSS